MLRQIAPGESIMDFGYKETIMREERYIISDYRRVPNPRLSWPAIFGGTFFAFGIILVLSLVGLAVGAAVAGPQGAAHSVGIWAAIWSLVTAFVGFYGGGWLAAKGSRSPSKADGRMHGIVTWSLGLSAIFYLLLTSTERLATIVASLTGAAVARNVAPPTITPGVIESMTVTAAVSVLIWTLCALVGAVIGGHNGGYRETRATNEEIRRAA